MVHRLFLERTKDQLLDMGILGVVRNDGVRSWRVHPNGRGVDRYAHLWHFGGNGISFS
jgi:hypothetical protein